jgi:hypothetical protein
VDLSVARDDATVRSDDGERVEQAAAFRLGGACGDEALERLGDRAHRAEGRAFRGPGTFADRCQVVAEVAKLGKHDQVDVFAVELVGERGNLTEIARDVAIVDVHLKDCETEGNHVSDYRRPDLGATGG